MVTKTLIDPRAHGSLSTFLFFAHLDVIYDLYPNRHTTKHNKVVTKENMGTERENQGVAPFSFSC